MASAVTYRFLIVLLAALFWALMWFGVQRNRSRLEMNAAVGSRLARRLVRVVVPLSVVLGTLTCWWLRRSVDLWPLALFVWPLAVFGWSLLVSLVGDQVSQRAWLALILLPFRPRWAVARIGESFSLGIDWEFYRTYRRLERTKGEQAVREYLENAVRRGVPGYRPRGVLRVWPRDARLVARGDAEDPKEERGRGE